MARCHGRVGEEPSCGAGPERFRFSVALEESLVRNLKDVD